MIRVYDMSGGERLDAVIEEPTVEERRPAAVDEPQALVMPALHTWVEESAAAAMPRGLVGADLECFLREMN